ncbi:MAG TPA: hypothetical protein ENK82_09510, partial [Campylobacterales bacterium]|nr:hypothetical protein [Campylobacterales bacterium]
MQEPEEFKKQPSGERNYQLELFEQKSEVHKQEVKSLKKQIFISNLKVWIIALILIAEIILIGAFF